MEIIMKKINNVIIFEPEDNVDVIDLNAANTQRDTTLDLEEQIQRIMNFALFVLDQRKN